MPPEALLRCKHLVAAATAVHTVVVAAAVAVDTAVQVVADAAEHSGTLGRRYWHGVTVEAGHKGSRR